MPRFRSYDSTELAYHVQGAGPPLVCLPGGPARASSYLGDLGGLVADRTLIMLDQRGTGESAVPADESSYRCDRIADDVEALRLHLALDRMDVLAHSAGATVAHLYASRCPGRIAKLALVTPSLRAVGLPAVGAAEAQASRSCEWWFAEARAAAFAWDQAVAEGRPSAELAPLWQPAAPFAYGRWDERARAHSEAETWERSHPGTDGFYAGFEPDTALVRAALKALDVPVLVLAGELDAAPTPEAARRLAALYPRAEVVVQAGASHYPWVDNPVSFRTTVRDWLVATG
nr:alpha/beta hydrolase [Micromonospora sp. DSM 115978]